MSPASPGASRAHPAGRAGPPAWIRRALEVPLAWKLLVANGFAVAVGVAATAWVAGRLAAAGSAAPARGALLLGGGPALLLAVVMDIVLVRLALAPLRSVEDAALRVGDGDGSARASASPLADRRLRRLTLVFNRMLDGLEAGRARERELAIRLLEAEEVERRRVAWALFDGPAQTLASLLLRGRAAARGVATPDPAVEPLMADVRIALAEVRRIARALRPPELDDLGLLPALGALARSVSEDAGTVVHVRAPADLPPLAPGSDLAAYRCVEEALRNAVQHAGARRVLLVVTPLRDRGCLRIEVRDDGVAFEPARAHEGARPASGLFAMEERGRRVGGSVRIDAGPDRGTRVVVEVPLAGVPGPVGAGPDPGTPAGGGP